MSHITSSIGYRMDFTVRNLRRYATGLFRQQQLDLTMDQWAILNITKDHKGISHLTLLSQLMVKDPPTLTKMVDSLCKKKFLERQLNPKDRRKWDLHITKAGLDAEQKAFAVVQQVRQEVSDILSQKELDQLSTILEKINTSIHPGTSS